MSSSTYSELPLALLLPGSGSDHLFVRAAFGAPLRAAGIALCAPPPRPGAEVVVGYRHSLDDAARVARRDGRRLLVGGVSLGAQVAARWAAAHPGPPLGGLLLALPAWTGSAGDAPAALAALATAQAVRRDGLAATVDATRANTPEWLAEELARAWHGHGDRLADSLEAAAATAGPTEAELGAIEVPAALVGLRDDPVHPWTVAARWRRLLTRSALFGATLAGLGADRAILGRAAMRAWLRASGSVTPRAGGGPDARPAGPDDAATGGG
jgi:pimeloyl-ACP methyl ester carboxylesterase